MKNKTMAPAPPVWGVIAAFAAVYVIWGSTYLGIRYAVESIPPFLMAGTRNLTAGLLLYAFARARGGATPSRIEWRDAAITGGLLLAVGNGGVTWAEQVIPSSVTALLVALTPMWMVLFDWLRPRGVRPRPLVVAGLAVGFVGVALLARGQGDHSGPAHGWGVVVLMASSLSWAFGSIFSRQAHKPASPLLGVAMQMMAGGSFAARSGGPARRGVAIFLWPGDLVVRRCLAVSDRGGVVGGLHLLRVAAARHHARARGDLCLREPVHRRAARLHHWPRSVLARIAGGGRVDHPGGRIDCPWRSTPDRRRDSRRRSGLGNRLKVESRRWHAAYGFLGAGNL